MKIDQHPFPANMVDICSKGKNALQTKVLTSESAKKSGVVDARIQVSVGDLKRKAHKMRQKLLSRIARR
jgi:hypothetical protein